MDFSKITLFQMMQTKMSYTSERTDVLSHNIANIDTPGYRARDLKELDFNNLVQAEARRLRMRSTSAMHSTGTSQMPDDFRGVKKRPTYETTPVKNNISVEQQMALVAGNQMEHQLATNLYTKTVGLFKTAINNR